MFEVIGLLRDNSQGILHKVCFKGHSNCLQKSSVLVGGKGWG